MQKKWSDSFCPYYDQGLLIESTPEGQSQIAMCCFQKRQQVSQIKFDDPYLEMLRKIGQNSIPSQCSGYCSIPSHINNERELSCQESWWEPGVKHIKKLHLKQSLLCNLKCISCSSAYSSAWNENYRLFDPAAARIRLIKKPEDSWKDLDLSHLTQLHFDGGEPLLDSGMKKILIHLRKINALKNLTININTNGTKMPDRELIDLWSEAKWIRLFFSLDGTGTTFEYTRFPAKWHEVEKNMFEYTQISGPCLCLEVNAVVGIHNIFNMPAFYDWWSRHLPLGNQGDPTRIWIKPIEPVSYGGKVLSLEKFPKKLYDIAKKTLVSLQDCPGSRDLVSILCTGTEDDSWKDYLDRIDKLHDTDWRSMLPIELQE